MPWKERYTISDEKSLADDEIRWPQGARCCFGNHRRFERRGRTGWHSCRRPEDPGG
jgi:hypothetical protein